jgi:murein DD-endopeptidase MepM/ murein hydrolase activator NlpD
MLNNIHMFAKTECKKHKFIEKSSKGSGFSFPLPSFATIAVVAGTILLATTALKWDDLGIKAPERYVFQPGSEDTTMVTMRYAATGVSTVIQPETQEQKPETQAVEAVNEPTHESPPQDADTSGILVSFKWQQYKVQKGDSVSSIAKKFDVSIGAVIASNEIKNARHLREGAVLRIPNIDGIPYSVKSGDNLSKIALSFNVPMEVILDVNDLRSTNIRAGETLFIPGARMNDMDLRLSLGDLFIYPVQSRYITSRFGMRKDPINGSLSFHTGIDLRANIGTPVLAAMEGSVSVVGENWVYGRYIIMSHPNGYKTLYAHLNAYSVKQGERVSQGRKIAESGNTGYSTGAHLHFTIYDQNNKLVNPLDLLR